MANMVIQVELNIEIYCGFELCSLIKRGEKLELRFPWCPSSSAKGLAFNQRSKFNQIDSNWLYFKRKLMAIRVMTTGKNRIRSKVKLRCGSRKIIKIKNNIIFQLQITREFILILSQLQRKVEKIGRMNRFRWWFTFFRFFSILRTSS